MVDVDPSAARQLCQRLAELDLSRGGVDGLAGVLADLIRLSDAGDVVLDLCGMFDARRPVFRGVELNWMEVAYLDPYLDEWESAWIGDQGFEAAASTFFVTAHPSTQASARVDAEEIRALVRRAASWLAASSSLVGKALELQAVENRIQISIDYTVIGSVESSIARDRWWKITLMLDRVPPWWPQLGGAS